MGLAKSPPADVLEQTEHESQHDSENRARRGAAEG